jgi:P-type Ca2+ transporter type 2C
MANNFDLNDVASIKGLSEEEAGMRLKQEGYNEIPSAKKRSFFAIIWGVLREPMLLLLIGGGIIYMILGDLEEALMLLGFVFVIIGITIYQERRTERTLEALRDLSSPRAMVIRDSATHRIAGREVAREDVVVLSEGDRVPADGVVMAGNNLTVEESILTGESVPVNKVETATEIKEMGRPGGDNSPFVYSGTMVVSGLAIIRVLATGMNTEFGKIGRSLQSIETEETLLQKETRKIVRNLAILGGSLSVILAIVYGVTIGNWLNGLLASITLAMAILPEEFPVVLTIFMALGAWRISQSHVLTRRMPAIETLGSDTVLCVDKTGTLTMNHMSVSRIFAGDEFHETDTAKTKALPEKFHELIEFSILASQTNPFDPMEKALKELGDRYQPLTEHLHSDWTFVREYPLSRELLALSRVWKSPDGTDYIIATKGAPEAIFDLCHLDPAVIQYLSEKINIMAQDGLRILGVAKAQFRPVSLPGNQHEFSFIFIGLVAFADPIRPTVPASIKECYTAGIRTVMITGDYSLTACRIAHDIGLRSPDNVITGIEMNKMSDDVLGERIKTVNVFARVVPEQKLRLVNAFKANGEIVAMTGDGVNDAPALKAANIGIAMGGRGTDVAREAGSLVLLDDDFSSIVKAVRLGRRIFDNLRKAMAYILAVHVPIAGLSLLPVLFKWPLVLMPVHVLFLELIIDPASSVAFEAEAEESNIMNRPPRNRTEPMLSRRIVIMSVLQGLMILGVTMVIYGLNLNRSEAEGRTLAFTTLVLANLGLILANRFMSGNLWQGIRGRNKAFSIIAAATVAFLCLVIYVPGLREVFRFSILHPIDILLCLGAGVACILWFQAVKYITSKKIKNKKLSI